MNSEIEGDTYDSLLSYDDGAKFFEAVLGGMEKTADEDEGDFTYELDSDSSSYFTSDNSSDSSSYFISESDNENEDENTEESDKKILNDLYENIKPEESPFVENMDDIGKIINKLLNSL